MCLNSSELNLTPRMDMADPGGIITNKNTDLTLGISLYRVIQFVTFFSLVEGHVFPFEEVT